MPRPPRTYDGRTSTGYPTRRAIVRAASALVAEPPGDCGIPLSRSSASQRRRGVHAAVVELDALADPDRPGTDHRNRGVSAPDDFVLIFVGRVVIGRDGFELSGAGINLAEGRLDHRHREATAAQFGDPGIVKATALGAEDEFARKPPPCPSPAGGEGDLR